MPLRASHRRITPARPIARKPARIESDRLAQANKHLGQSTDTRDEAEAVLENNEIGLVRAGQVAELKVETFPFTRGGAMPAQVNFVSGDAIKDGKQYGTRYRYSGKWEEPWQRDTSWLKGYIKFYLDRLPAPDLAPRYAVTFEDHVAPEVRALAIASLTLKVRDMQTHEVLAEHTVYALTGGFGIRSSTSPWLVARECSTNSGDPQARTRQFVDQVLIPKKDR